jgi:hypothetical protein
MASSRDQAPNLVRDSPAMEPGIDSKALTSSTHTRDAGAVITAIRIPVLKLQKNLLVSLALLCLLTTF